LDRAPAVGDCELRLLHTLDLQVSFDLELPQLAHERPRFTSKTVRFTFERADALVDTTCLGFGSCAFRHLRREPRHERDQKHQLDDGLHAPAHLLRPPHNK
jgi:hypothetical protein